MWKKIQFIYWITQLIPAVLFLPWLFPIFASAQSIPPTVANMTPGTWLRVPNSNLSAVNPCPANNCSYSSVTGVSAVMDAWSGGTFDSTRNRLIIWGGGHNDYAGNEVYAFDLATLSWSRLTNPSTPNTNNSGTYGDGTPSSRHTYATVAYLPNVDRMFNAGGAIYQSGNGNNMTWFFNFSNNTWQRRTDAPSPSNGECCGHAAAYDPVTGHVFRSHGGGLSEYDPNNNTWTNHGGSSPSLYINAAIAPADRLMVAVGGGSYGVAGTYYWRLNPLSGALNKASTSGDKTVELGAAPGFAWSSSANVFVGWNGGSAVYTLDPKTWVWTKIDPAVANTVIPTAPNSRGTYGRFQYVPAMNVFVLVNRVNEDVYIYKPAFGGSASPSPTPTVQITASPSSLTSGSSSTLTWTSTNASSCTASGAWSGTKAISGSQSAGALTANSTFTLTCTGTAGSASQSAVVTIAAAPVMPTIQLTASPASITSGSSSTLTWSSTNASSCSASGGWSGAKSTSGSQSTGNLTANATFILTCTGAAGSASQSAIVSVTTPTTPAPPAPPLGSIPAFPGAEGFGTETPGGRGGKVYVVTTLNWSGPGSLGEALLATGPRIIVFRVSGVINVPDGVELTEANSYVTVAGQTSPGGITLTGSPGYFIGNYQTNFHDAVFRFIRFRGRGNYDNIQFNGAHHLVFDHVDFSGGMDESFDITHGRDVTIQWSTITNSDSSDQNYGSLIAYNPTANFSIHHNFYAHHANRCAPHFHWSGGVPSTGAIVDFRNNVVYNCAFDAIMWTNDASSSAEGSGIKFNLIGNYFKAGPNTPSAAYDYRLPAGSQRYESNTIYQGGSLKNLGNLSSPVPVPLVTTQSAAEAFNLVLDRAGAFPRDPMNTRTVAETRNGTGSLGKINDAFLTSAPTPPVDSDLDGMPDSWESARGLNPFDPSDAARDRDGDGYTNIEEYINELAASLNPGSPTPPPQPSFDFTVSNGGNKSVAQGSSVPNTITTSLIAGTTQSVSFSTSGLPTGTTYTYSPSSCNPNCSTAFTIAAGTSTPTGTYPITVTAAGGGLTKTTSFNLTVTSSTTPPPTSTVLQVGPTRQYTTIISAVTAAQDGYTIEIDADVYSSQTLTISKNNLTLRGIGGYAYLKWGTGDYLTNTSTISNGKGIMIIQGNNITIENFEFSGAKVVDENGAGIRYEGGNLTIRKSYFHDNENGILGEGGLSDTLLIESSVFERNGYCPSLCAHNIYIGTMGKLIFRYNKSIDAREGHPLKSRAQINEIISNYLSTKNSDGSYEADFPNGGTVYFIGNIVEQGANTGNSSMLAYGEEGSTNPNPALYIVNNTFYNQRGSGTFLSVSGSPTLAVKNNIFAGGGSFGVNADASNKTLTASSFINVSSSDYHLAAGSPAIDAGVNPGTAGSYNLAPQSEYVEPAGRKVRVTSGSAIDVGAHEFGSSPSSSPAAPTGLSLK
jgi:hypothetical protein